MGAEVRQLLRAAADGDAEAWPTLVERYSSLVWAVVHSFRLGADAEDAVQTTWIRLVENLDRIACPDALPGWLTTTASRECLRLVRRAGRERPGFAPDELPEQPSDAEPVETGLLVAERDAALRLAVAAIPARCRQVVQALMAEPAPSYAEVAARLDMALGSVGPTRLRAIGHLRRIATQHEVLRPAG